MAQEFRFNGKIVYSKGFKFFAISSIAIFASLFFILVRPIGSTSSASYLDYVFLFAFWENADSFSSFKKKDSLVFLTTPNAPWEASENSRMDSDLVWESSSESADYFIDLKAVTTLGLDPIEKQEFELEVYLDRILYFSNLSQVRVFYFSASGSFDTQDRSENQDYSEKSKEDPVADLPVWNLLSGVGSNFWSFGNDRSQLGLSCFSYSILGFEDSIGFCCPKYSSITFTLSKKLSRYLARLHHSDPDTETQSFLTQRRRAAEAFFSEFRFPFSFLPFSFLFPGAHRYA